MNQGFLCALTDNLSREYYLETLLLETVESAAIEGEKLDLNGVRSSIASKLGLSTAGLPVPSRYVDGFVSMLLDATENYSESLTDEKLFGWQSALFPSGRSGFQKIEVGKWRSNDEAMQIISGSMGNEKIHYEAPPSTVVEKEISLFLNWWNNPPENLDGVVRAAIAHYWFAAIHPFSDGNGRIARCLADMALAQDEQSSKRLFSLSSMIVSRKSQYYGILEEISNGCGDLTSWIKWFLEIVLSSQKTVIDVVENSKKVENFYKNIREIELKARQLKVLKKMIQNYPLEYTGGMTNKKYVTITKVSPETAKRDLKVLFDFNILEMGNAGGRSFYYVLNNDLFRG